MIVVKCNKNDFAYDVHSLVKAFYPAEEVKVFEEGEKSLSSDCNLPEIFMCFEENKILKQELLKRGLAKESTCFVVTHFTHNQAETHEKIEEIFAGSGIDVAYDGYEMEI